MSKNYTNYSKNNTYEPDAIPAEDPVETETPIIEDPVLETRTAEAEEELPTIKRQVIGEVVDCKNLRVRYAPALNAKVISEIPVGTKVEICEDEGSSDFHKVNVVDGPTGFCMKRYIKVLQ